MIVFSSVDRRVFLTISSAQKLAPTPETHRFFVRTPETAPRRDVVLGLETRPHFLRRVFYLPGSASIFARHDFFRI
jgi:hypothetical protein